MNNLSNQEIIKRATQNFDKDYVLSVNEKGFTLHLTTDFEKQFPDFENNTYMNNIDFTAVIKNIEDYQLSGEVSSKKEIEQDIAQKSSTPPNKYRVDDAHAYLGELKKLANLEQINSAQHDLKRIIDFSNVNEGSMREDEHRKYFAGILKGESKESLISRLYPEKRTLLGRIFEKKAIKKQRKYNIARTDALDAMATELMKHPYFGEIKKILLEDIKEGEPHQVLEYKKTLKKIDAMTTESGKQRDTQKDNMYSQYAHLNTRSGQEGIREFAAWDLTVKAVNAGVINQAGKQFDEKIDENQAIVDKNKARIKEERINRPEGEISGVVKADNEAQVKIDSLKTILAARLINSEEKNNGSVMEDIKKQGFDKETLLKSYLTKKQCVK